MSVCTFLASDHPLLPVKPSKAYPLAVNVDTGEIFDGGADDNFFLHPFLSVKTYTDKPYGVWLEWNYTEGRAKQLLSYIEEALDHSETVEFWHVWLMDYWEFEDRPVLHKYIASISELTAEDIKQLDVAEIWNNQEKDRPSFSCLTITK